MIDNRRQQIIIAEELLSRAKAKESLYEFVKQSWKYIEGDRPFVDGWHIKAFCDHLEAVTRGEIRKLLVNLPPRMMKSTILAVMWPAWVWITNPEKQFLFASYALQLSIRDSVKCRRLIESTWYQSRWGDVFKLSGDQNAKMRFENDRSGIRLATSIEGSSTGEGGDYIIGDDLNNAKDGESEVTRTATNEWFDRVFSTRLNDPKTGCIVIQQQRLNALDVSGHLMANDQNNLWVKFILAMEFEPFRKCKSVPLPGTNGKPWEDPRTKDCELLWPERIGPKELIELKQSLGSEYAIAGQLQQRPAPSAGGIIKKHHFKWWKQSRPPQLEHVIQSWDTALEASDSNCYSACSTWGLFLDNNMMMNIILLSLWRGKLEYPDLRKMAQRLYADYRDDNLEIKLRPDGNHIPDVVLVEAKVSGISLVQDLMRAGIAAIRFDPNRFGDKILRVRSVTHLIEAGRVWLPAKPPDYTKLRNFADVFIENCALFPNGDSRDIVDTMTQVLLRLNASGWLSNPSDRNTRDTSVAPPSEPFY